MRRFSTAILLIPVLLLFAFAIMGAVPNQGERPPQPLFQDFFSGTVLLQDSQPPEGTQLVACIDDCETVFQSAPYNLKADGRFDQLEVNPTGEELVGHTIYFYLVNDYGRIRAEESRPYIGVFDFYVQDLTFVDPLPVPEPTPKLTPTASLPIAGDPAVAQLPKVALMAGGAAVVAGAGLLLVARRRVA